MKQINSIINDFIGPDKLKTITPAIISFLVLGIIFYFVFLPGLRQARLLSNQIKDKKINLDRVKIPTGEYDLLQDKINNTKSQLEALKKKLFWEKDISKFLNELTQLASGLPMEFVSWKPEAVVPVLSTEKDKKDKKVLDYSIMQAPISVVLKADYNSLAIFLKRMEEADRFIKIDTFIIEPDQRDIYKQNINMKLNIFVKEEG